MALYSSFSRSPPQPTSRMLRLRPGLGLDIGARLLRPCPWPSASCWRSAGLRCRSTHSTGSAAPPADGATPCGGACSSLRGGPAAAWSSRGACCLVTARLRARCRSRLILRAALIAFGSRISTPSLCAIALATPTSIPIAVVSALAAVFGETWQAMLTHHLRPPGSRVSVIERNFRCDGRACRYRPARGGADAGASRPAGP